MKREMKDMLTKTSDVYIWSVTCTGVDLGSLSYLVRQVKVLFFFSFLSPMQKLPGQELNLRHSSGNTESSVMRPPGNSLKVYLLNQHGIGILHSSVRYGCHVSIMEHQGGKPLWWGRVKTDICLENSGLSHISPKRLLKIRQGNIGLLLFYLELLKRSCAMQSCFLDSSGLSVDQGSGFTWPGWL